MIIAITQEVDGKLKTWANWRRSGQSSGLGYPSQSAEQSANSIRGSRNTPLPEWEEEMKIDRAVEELQKPLKTIIYCRYRIPMTLAELVDHNVAISSMVKSNDIYHWQTNHYEGIKAIGYGREEYSKLLGYAQAIISQKLS